VAAGAVFTVAYLIHARRTPTPALDLTLFRVPTFRVSVVGGFIFRIGIGALPFLLPLMLQIGFGMSPFASGLITFVGAVGAMGMKFVAAPVLRRFGFRAILVFNSVLSAALLGACALFNTTTPVTVMLLILLVGGFFRSLQFTCINTLAYADVEPGRVSRATSLVSVAQQLAISTGVAVGALAVETSMRLRGHDVLQALDFQIAFLAVAMISAGSVVLFANLSRDDGAELADRLPPPSGNPAESADQKVA
jgi:MFS family permease